MSAKLFYFIYFLDYFNVALVLPLVNPHVLSLGGSRSVGGILVSISSGMQLLASPVIGSWSDTRGRKPLLLYTLTGVLIADVLLGLSWLPLFFISRILDGMMRQTDPLVRALIVDNVPQDAQTAALSKLVIIQCLAFFSGPVLGGYFYELFKGFQFISAFTVASDLILIALTFMFVKDTSSGNTKSEKVEVKSEKVEVKQGKTFTQLLFSDLAKVFSNIKNVDWAKYGDLLNVKVFLETSFSFLFVNMGMILRDIFSFNGMQLGMAITFLSSSTILGSLCVETIKKKFYRNDETGFKRISHSCSLLIAIVFALPFTVHMNTSVLYLSLLVPTCAAKILLENTFTEVLLGKITESEKGIMMGAATGILSLTKLICPLISGFIADYISVSGLTLLPILPAVLGVLLTKKLQYQEGSSMKKDD